MNLIQSKTVTTPTSALGFAVPSCNHFELRTYYVKADLQPGAALNCYLSSDGGQTYDAGPNYMNVAGPARFFGEPNASEWSMQPWAKGPQTLDLGCRLGIDTGDRDGANIVAKFTNLGSVAGRNVSPFYTAYGHSNPIGGSGGIARPAHLGGGKWFDGPGIHGVNQTGKPFDWHVDWYYSGHWRNPGAKISALLLTMNGGGTLGRLIESGLFELWV